MLSLGQSASCLAGDQKRQEAVIFWIVDRTAGEKLGFAVSWTPSIPYHGPVKRNPPAESVCRRVTPGGGGSESWRRVGCLEFAVVDGGRAICVIPPVQLWHARAARGFTLNQVQRMAHKSKTSFSSCFCSLLQLPTGAT